LSSRVFHAEEMTIYGLLVQIIIVCN